MTAIAAARSDWHAVALKIGTHLMDCVEGCDINGTSRCPTFGALWAEDDTAYAALEAAKREGTS